MSGEQPGIPATPGRHVLRLSVTTDLNGQDVAVTMHVLVGERPGPTLTLLSGAHGNEWGHLEFFADFLNASDPAEISGTVRIVPVANAPALGALSRAVLDDSDQPDVNRSFPGEGRRFTWLAEQIATTIAEQVLPGSDAVLEFHVGIWGSAMGSSIMASDYSDTTVQERTWALALAFGTPLIFATKAVSGFPGPRSLLGYAGEKLGIPTSGSMLGGAGFARELETTWHAANLRGIRNVMIHLGMIEGVQDLPGTALVYETVHRVNPRNGGLLVPRRQPDEFGRAIDAGELLGEVISPYTLDVIERLESPMDGYLAYWARDYPVRPGDWSFGVIPRDHPGTREVSLTSD
jgi:predicted deacylase